jgi:hypothetical protein
MGLTADVPVGWITGYHHIANARPFCATLDYIRKFKENMMISEITQYIFTTENTDAVINGPVREDQIKILESELGFQLPNDYKEFLRLTNGFEGYIGDTHAIFEPAEEILNYTQRCCSEFFPWAIYFGSNGSTEMFVMDKRFSPIQFGLQPFIGDDNDFIPSGSFQQFLKRLSDGSAFN